MIKSVTFVVNLEICIYERERERRKRRRGRGRWRGRRPVIGSAGYFARGTKRDYEFWCTILTY